MISEQIKQMRQVRRKAFGLLEVLIAIAISALVMLGAVAVSARSIRIVRQNELQDLSNGVLLMSLEIARSPARFDLNSQITGTGKNYFVLARVRNIDEQEERMTLQRITTATGEIDECTDGPYKVDLLDVSQDLDFVDSDFAEAYTICNQIEIEEKRRIGSRRTFQIRSILVYKLFDEDIKKELISERTEIVI